MPIILKIHKIQCVPFSRMNTKNPIPCGTNIPANNANMI